MTILAAPLGRSLPPLPDRLSSAEWLEIGDVLDAAVAWFEGMPLDEFARIGTLPRPAGGLPSAGYTRHVAMRVTPLTDPRMPAFRRALDALLRLQGYEVTTHGVFERADIVGIPILSRPPEAERWVA